MTGLGFNSIRWYKEVPATVSVKDTTLSSDSCNRLCIAPIASSGPGRSKDCIHKPKKVEERERE